MKGLLIVGAGGHGKVVADTAYETGRWGKIAFLDDRYPMEPVFLWPVIGKPDQAEFFIKEYAELTVAIGNNRLRVQLLKMFKEKGFHLPIILHPTAYVSKSAVLGEGSVIFSQSAIHVGAEIGFGCIVNTGSTVDHECTLGEGVHLSPGVHLAGEVRVGNYSWLGIGSSVIQQVSIGQQVILGAGAVAIKNIGNGVTVVGVPGRVIKEEMNDEGV